MTADSTQLHEDIEQEWWHEPEEESQELAAPPRSGVQALAQDDVSWAEDKQQPDYRHLDVSFAEEEFEFTGADLELIIRENRFEPTREEERILFGLRGATLAEGNTANGQSLRLRLARPDHRTFRCVIGVYNTTTRQISGFAGSTVPWYAYVHDYYARGRGEPKTNLLPTGCYPYFVGPHGKHQIPGCFRLGTGHDKDQQERVAVLRTVYDVRYDTSDVFDASIPHANLHPAFGGRIFRSRGCQTVRGNYEGGHTGEWAEFRNAAGLGPHRADNGKRFDYVLVTGVEAAIASKLRSSGLVGNSSVVLERVTRLRHGSRGELVANLQRKLGLTPTGSFGAQETKALTALQRKKFSFADGIYSPDMDTRLEFNILKSAPVATPAQVRHISAGSKRIALVIGNGAYTAAQALGNPTRDADAFAEKLKALNFTVTLIRDASEQAMVQAIVKFKDDLTACHVGLIFYAGHGVQIDGENYVLPTDCKPDTVAELRQSSVALGTLLEPLEESGKVGIIVLDCCRDNPFRGRSLSRSLRRGFANLGAPAGTFIAFSTQPGATASDGDPDGHSPFAASLLQHITTEDQDIGQMMRTVRKEVNNKTEGRQLPWDQSSLMVDHFAFKQSNRSLEQRVLTREELDRQQKETAREREEEYWSLTSTSNSEQLLESFIAQYPDSKYRTEADDKLNAIRAEAARIKARARAREFQFRAAIAGLAVLAVVTGGLYLLFAQLTDWQSRAYNGQFRLLLSKARDNLDAENPDEARSQALAAHRILREQGKDVEHKLRVDFANVVTESMKQDADVVLEQSTGVKSVKAAFTRDGAHIVWTDDGPGKDLNISEASTGKMLDRQMRNADKVETLIVSTEGSQAALLSKGLAELFFVHSMYNEWRLPDYSAVSGTPNLRAIAFGKAGTLPLLAAIDRNGDIFGWRIDPQKATLEPAVKLPRAGPPLKADNTGAGFAINCFENLCVWALPDGSVHAAELGLEPGSGWRQLQGTHQLKQWSTSGSIHPLLRLAKGRLVAYSSEQLDLYEVASKQGAFELNHLRSWYDPALAAVELDEEQKLMLRYFPGKANPLWTVQSEKIAFHNSKFERERIYYRDYEKEVLDFNLGSKSVVLSQQARAGLNALKRRTDVVRFPELECLPHCELVNWLGARDRVLVGWSLKAKGEYEVHEFRLGDGDSQPSALEKLDLRKLLQNKLRGLREKAKDTRQGQPIVHAVAHALDAKHEKVFALIVAPEFATETKIATETKDEIHKSRVRSAAFVAVIDLKTRQLDGDLIAIKPWNVSAPAPQAVLALTGPFSEKMDRDDVGERQKSVQLSVLVNRDAKGKITAEYAPDRWWDIRPGGKAGLLSNDGIFIRIESPAGDEMRSANRRHEIRLASGRGRTVDFGFLDNGNSVFIAYEEGQVDVWDIANRQSQPLTITTRMKLTSPLNVTWSLNPILKEQVLHVHNGNTIKSFSRAGVLLERYAPGRWPIGAMIPLANGDLFAVIDMKHVVLPAAPYKFEMKEVPYTAEAVTRRLLDQSDDDIVSNWFLPSGASSKWFWPFGATGKSDDTPNPACHYEADTNYPHECTRLHKYYATPDQKALAISEHAYRALERKSPGRGTAFALAEVAAGNPLAVALIALELTRGESNWLAESSMGYIRCEQPGIVDAMRALYTRARQGGRFIAPYYAALELQCGSRSSPLGGMTAELNALGERGDPMALVLLGHEYERSAKEDLSRAKALEHYGIASRLLLAQRDRRQHKEVVPEQLLIDSIEQEINDRRVKLAEKFNPKELATIFGRVETRFSALRNFPAKREPGAADAKAYTVKDMLGALGKLDDTASITKAVGLLDEWTGKKLTGKFQALEVRGHFEVVRRANEAKASQEKSRSAYLHFLSSVQRLPAAVYAKAVIEVDKALDEKKRNAILSTERLREFATHFAERAKLDATGERQMFAEKRADVYLELSEATDDKKDDKKLATRLAIAALQTSENLPRNEANANTLLRAQNRALELVGTKRDYDAEFKLVSWNYLGWISDYLYYRFDMNPSDASRLLDTGLQLHVRYVEARAQSPEEYGPLRQRLAEDYNVAGRFAFARAEYIRAADAFTKVIDIKPEDRGGYMDRGRAYELQREYDRAVSDYSKAIEISPRWDEAYRFRGAAFRGLKEFDKSIADYNKALEIDPGDPNYFLGRGYTHLARNDLDGAMTDFDKVLQLSPRYDEGFRFRGIAWIMKGEFDKAVDDFTEALEIDPGDDNYYNGRAWAHFKAGRLEQAQADAEKAVSIIRFNPAECRDTLGRILMARGKTDEANAAFAEAQKHKPGLQLTVDDTLKRLAP